jgi:hypothetical protein
VGEGSTQIVQTAERSRRDTLRHRQTETWLLLKDPLPTLPQKGEGNLQSLYLIPFERYWSAAKQAAAMASESIPNSR